MSNLNGSNSSVELNNNQSKENINENNLALKVDRLYVKEINCKIPHAPGLFEAPEFKENAGQLSSSIEMNIKTQLLAKDKYEVVLHAIIHGKAKNLSLFTLEVQQAGVFTINVPASQIEQIIKNNCVSFLHAYLSQAVTNAIVQAGFPPIVLQPLQPIINQDTSQEPLSSQKNNEIVEPVKYMQGTLEKGTLKPN